MLTRLSKGELVLHSPKFRQMMKINFPFLHITSQRINLNWKILNSGKKVLDNLIEGMYVDCFFIFREYIQNASDSIDEAVNQGFLANRREGQIEITLSIDSAIIKDNGVGVSKVNAIEELGDIGASKKT